MNELKLVPLGISNRSNSATPTPKGSPKRNIAQMSKATAITTPSRSSVDLVSSLATLQSDFNKLEKSYADLLRTTSKITAEKFALEEEVLNKSGLVQHQDEKLRNFEKIIDSMKSEYSKNQGLYNKEAIYYKELVSDLESKVAQLKRELANRKPEIKPDNNADLLQLSSKHAKLLKDFKVLQSNFELEQNSKLALMDQIEYLNGLQDRNDKIDRINEQEFSSDFEQEKEVHINDTFHTLNALQVALDANDPDDDEEDEEKDNDKVNHVHKESPILGSLADDLDLSSSSPLKQHSTEEATQSYNFPISHSSNLYSQSCLLLAMESTPNFQFPPSPEKNVLHRRSLPTKIKTGSPQFDHEPFVPSPLKLAGNSEEMLKTERYSSSIPHHSRYNSHDIVPIKVEFESLEHSIRSTSVPEKYQQQLGRRESYNNNHHNNRNSAFLNNPDTTHEEATGFNSFTDSSTSKRSSVSMDQSFTSDKTRQEIMKLKFELQSLKLHNEKLLSYIGFELQKQKKNIKKLKHKQSLTNMGRQMEYSDAKLIEKSREMLIQKKRVLRSVSINGVLPLKQGRNRHSIIGNGIFEKPLRDSLFGHPENGESLFDNDDVLDVYGYFNRDSKHQLAFLTDDMKNYYDIDSISDSDKDEDYKVIGTKKYKSQVFAHNLYSSDDIESDEDENDTTTLIKTKENDSIVHDSGVLKQIRNFITGLNLSEIKETGEGLQDDTLKYKFVTLAIGIMIIGFRFSHKEISQA